LIFVGVVNPLIAFFIVYQTENGQPYPISKIQQ